MIGVDEYLEAIRVRALIAARQTGNDRIGMRVVQARTDVQRGVVIREVHDGTFRGHRPLRGIPLRKAGYPLRGAPQRFIERAVDADSLAAGESDGAQLLGRWRRGRWRIDHDERRMTTRQCEEQLECRRHRRPGAKVNGNPGRER